jgi:hypothetical protein
MGAGAEDNILAAQTDEFRESQPRLHRNEEQRPVPPARPRGLVGHCHEGIDLGPGEELDLPSMVTLYGYCQDALGQGSVERVMEGNVAEERMERRQSDISAAGSVAALLLEVVEEGAEKDSIKILEAHGRRRLLETALRKPKEETEGIAIARDGMRACVELTHEAVREECLQ